MKCIISVLFDLFPRGREAISDLILSFPSACPPPWTKQAGCGASKEGDHKGRPYRIDMA